MTLLEYITSLQDTGLSQEEIFAKAQEFKKTIGLEDTKVTETPVQEVKTEVVVEKDATAATTPVASESSSSGSGPSQLQVIDENISRSEEFIDYLDKRRAKSKSVYNSLEKAEKIANIKSTEPEEIKEDDFISKLISEDETGAFVLPVEILSETNEKINSLKKQQEEFSLMDPKSLEIQDEIDMLESSIDPVKTAKIRAEKLAEETSIKDYQLKDIQDKANEFVDNGETKITKKRIWNSSTKNYVETKTVEQNEDWFKAYEVAKNQYAKQNNIDLFKDVGRDRVEIEFTPEMNYEVKELMKLNYIENKSKAKAEENLENWIEDNRGVFTKSQIQNQQALYNKINAYDLSSKQKKAINTLNNSISKIDSIREEKNNITNLEFQTQEEIDEANRVYKILDEQERDLIDIYKENFKASNDLLEGKNASLSRLDLLERNYSYTSNFLNSIKTAGIDLALSAEELVFRIADAPRAFNFSGDKNFNAFSALGPLASIQMLNYTDDRKDVVKTVENYKEGIEQGMAKPQSLSDLSDGQDWGRYFATTIGSQIPNTVMLIGTGGAALPIMGMTSAGSSFREMQKEMDENPLINYSPAQMYGVAALNGVAEVLSERISLGIVNRAQKAYGIDTGIKKGFVDQLKSVFTKEGFKKVGLGVVDITGESVSEGGVELSSNIFDRYILGKEVDLFEGVADAMFSGLVMSGGVYKAPNLFKSVVNMVQGPDTNQKLSDNYSKIKETEGILAKNPKMSKKNQAVLQDKIAGLVKDSSNEINKTLNRFGTLPIETIKELSAIELEQFKIRKQLEGFDSDPNMSEQAKKELVKTSKLELQELSNKKQEILKPIIKADAEATTAEQVELNTRLKEGASVAISQLGAGVERVANTEDFLSIVSSLEAQGVEANVYRNKEGEVLPVEEQDYGIFAKVDDGKGGFDIQLIINDASARADGVLPADKHELLHIAAMKMDDATKVKIGISLKNSLLNDSNLEVSPRVKRLLEAYESDLNEGKITEADFYEEVMAVTSDGLTPNSKTGVAEIKTKDVSKFKAVVQKILQAIGWRQSFADGQQAIDFLKEFNADVLKGEGLSESVLSRFDTKTDTDVEAKVEPGKAIPSKKDTGAVASTKVQEIYDTQGEAGAFDIIEQFKPIVKRIVDKRQDAPNFDRQLLTDEIETGKRGIFDLIREYNPESGVPLAAYINKFLPARAIEASQRVLGETFTEDVTEAKGIAAEEVTTEVAEKPVTRKIKPSSLISNDAVAKIKEQVQEKIKGIDPKNLTFKKLGDLAPEIIAAEIGIPVKKLTDPKANLSKGDATAIQQFVNKNADKLLKILPEGAVVEAATEKLLGTSTGVPKGLLNAFYTKQARLGKGAGLAPFKLNKGISKADFLETFGIVEGKKAEGFDARSSQAQALKGIASLYGKLVTNEIVRSDTDLSLEAKQDVAAGKNKAMASKRLLAEANIKPGLVDEFLKATSSKGFNDILEAKLKDESIKQPWKSAATEYFKENPIEGLDLKARRQVISEISSVFSMKNEEVAVKRFSDRSFKELKNIIDESLASDLSKGYTFDTVDLITGDKTYRADERSLEGLNRIRVGVKILVDALASKGFNKQQIETALYGGFITPANIGGFRVGKEPTSILLTAENLGEKTKTSRGSMAVNINDFRNNFLKGIPEGEKVKTKKETYSKDYWTNPKSKFNKLDQAGKLEFIQDLFNEGSKVKLQLADLVETISELDVTPEVTRYMITQLFADMSALGKRASGTRYVLTDVNGKMFSFKELEKLGLTRPSGDKGVFEHTKPANRVAVAAYAFARTGDAKAKQEFLNELETFDSALITEQMDDMLRNLKLQSKMGLDYKSTDNPMLTRYKEMVSDLSEQGVFFYDIKTKKQITPLEALSSGLVELEADDVQSIKEYKKEVEVKSELVPGKVMASKRDSDLIPDAIKYDRPISVKTAINALEKTDKSLELARKLDQPVKKIRVFDFDDTLARTKSNVLYTMPDGTTGKIDAATFAKEAGNMEAEGAQWDFSEFSKVMQGSKGPLLDVAKIIADKRGTRDVFVLTARPADAAGPIKEFLASMGLDIPLANITGLGDGTPQAKAGWIMGKAAEGYNDFYFADDHTGNVKAVKDVLSQIDVKSKVQLAKASKRQTFDTVVNDMIEDSSGIEAYKKYSAARAKTVGASKGKYNFLIPPSAEDFTGLLYKMIGKGKKGDAQMAFLKTNLLDTYNRAESAVTQAKISAANDFVALKTKLKTLPKTLSKQTGIGKFTYSHAVRVAAWTKQGMDIPGLSKRDIKELNDFVNKDPKLRVFTDELIKIQKGKEYPKPDKEWLGGNITTDIIGGINKVNRAEYQQEWRENIDIIFSEDNLNKMEAAYGTRWREAIVDSIRRMKAGTNRPIGGNRVTEGLLDWLNNSVGAVMFLNTRSALLQTISAVNFINWGDNNIIKAGKAFANQKQFWGDFMTLMNSDYLVERRNGLKINVSESEIADAVRESKNKPKAAIAFLLSKGFVMTRFADSFAIASGGSTFYRNRLESLKKQGLSEDEAKARAFADFKAVAEESQQSSAPSKISQQQASAAGRVILAWANTPMQYARIQKRAAQDLINGRGDWKSNVSKIVYYGAIQNLIFNSLQQAVFALGFGDDEEETDEAKAKKKEEKAYKIANGMIDSQLKGLGIFGAASAAIKNTLMTLYEEYGKKGSKYENAVDDLLSFSPPLGSKIGKIKGGLRSFSWNMKDMKEKGFSLDNPAYMAGAQVVTGFTNIPLDRVAKKINNLRGLVNERSSLWQKVALGLGWGTWELGLGYYGGFDKEKPLTPKQQLQLEVDTMKKDTSKADQVKTLLDFGLTKKQIRELKNENNRVKKILELQKKDKDAGSKK